MEKSTNCSLKYVIEKHLFSNTNVNNLDKNNKKRSSQNALGKPVRFMFSFLMKDVEILAKIMGKNNHFQVKRQLIS